MADSTAAVDAAQELLLHLRQSWQVCKRLVREASSCTQSFDLLMAAFDHSPGGVGGRRQYLALLFTARLRLLQLSSLRGKCADEAAVRECFRCSSDFAASLLPMLEGGFCNADGGADPYVRRSLCLLIMHRLVDLDHSAAPKGLAWAPPPFVYLSAPTCKDEWLDPADEVALIDPDDRLPWEEQVGRGRGSQGSNFVEARFTWVVCIVLIIIVSKYFPELCWRDCHPVF